MTPPTPAAVRAALLYLGQDPTDEERDAYLADGRAGSHVLLRDHIRACAAKMRADAGFVRTNTVDPFMTPAERARELTWAAVLERFADKLEGKQ